LGYFEYSIKFVDPHILMDYQKSFFGLFGHLYVSVKQVMQLSAMILKKPFCTHVIWMKIFKENLSHYLNRLFKVVYTKCCKK